MAFCSGIIPGYPGLEKNVPGLFRDSGIENSSGIRDSSFLFRDNSGIPGFTILPGSGIRHFFSEIRDSSFLFRDPGFVIIFCLFFLFISKYLVVVEKDGERKQSIFYCHFLSLSFFLFYTQCGKDVQICIDLWRAGVHGVHITF